jgi:hypothetical protein
VHSLTRAIRIDPVTAGDRGAYDHLLATLEKMDAFGRSEPMANEVGSSLDLFIRTFDEILAASKEYPPQARKLFVRAWLARPETLASARPLGIARLELRAVLENPRRLFLGRDVAAEAAARELLARVHFTAGHRREAVATLEAISGAEGVPESVKKLLAEYSAEVRDD